jgi:D-glycerate 3-kinase
MSEAPATGQLQPGLLARCGCHDPARWQQGWLLRLGSDGAKQTAALIQPSLLWGFALPLLERLQGLAATGVRPLIALNGPVGAGKSSLARCLHQLAPLLGLRLAVASIDDAYLPWAERREALAGNPFGVSRVPPGSHDTSLLVERLSHWRAGGELVLPRFDKTLRGGQGDRCGDDTLQADAVVLEGWLLGCRSLGSALSTVAGAPTAWLTPEEEVWLPRWDAALGAYAPLGEPALGLVDGLWVLHPSGWQLPLRWRLQAEARQRRAGGAALPASAVAAIVRATLASLPPALYQDPLLHNANAAAVIDGRRRCLRVVVGDA